MLALPFSNLQVHCLFFKFLALCDCQCCDLVPEDEDLSGPSDLEITTLSVCFQICFPLLQPVFYNLLNFFSLFLKNSINSVSCLTVTVPVSEDLKQLRHQMFRPS